MDMNLQVFENPQFGKVRVQIIENDPWFCGKDVCEILGYAKPRNAIATHVVEEDARKQGVPTNGGIQEMIFINESGLYSLIFGSTLPIAKEFKRWVTSEVLPSIRKNGFYGNPKTLADIISPQELRLYSQKMIEYCNKVIELESKVEEMKPKVAFADAVAVSDTTILVGEYAKILKPKGFDFGQNRLFKWYRNNGWMIKEGSSRNMPTQKAMELGLFEIKETTIAKPDGVVKITKTPKITGKGQIYFLNLFTKLRESGNLIVEAWENGFKI